jgi:hypothetical protein
MAQIEMYKEGGTRLETTWEAFLAVGAVLEGEARKLGKGMQSINTYHMGYCTSDKPEFEGLKADSDNDDHVILYIDRLTASGGGKLDADTVGGTMGFYAFASGTEHDEDQLWISPRGLCVCPKCRDSKPYPFFNIHKDEERRCEWDDITCWHSVTQLFKDCPQAGKEATRKTKRVKEFKVKAGDVVAIAPHKHPWVVKGVEAQGGGEGDWEQGEVDVDHLWNFDLAVAVEDSTIAGAIMNVSGLGGVRERLNKGTHILHIYYLGRIGGDHRTFQRMWQDNHPQAWKEWTQVVPLSGVVTQVVAGVWDGEGASFTIDEAAHDEMMRRDPSRVHCI